MEVWELKLYFYPSAGGFKKTTKKRWASAYLYIPDSFTYTYIAYL